MSNWTEQDDGTFLGAATERALEWAGDDRHKLASVGFVAWLREMGVDPFWTVDDWNVVTIDPDWVIHTILDHSTVHEVFDVGEFQVEDKTTYAVVRILEGRTPLIHILGVTGTLIQTIREPRPWARAKFLQPLPWFLSGTRRQAA